MSYLINRYKNTYRLLCEYDQTTNQFNRKLDGTFEDVDVYIDCAKNIKVFYYGKGILEAYIPSIGVGHNIIKQIYANYINSNNVSIEQSEIKTGLGTGVKISYNIKDTSLYENELKNLTNKDIIFEIMETDEEVIFKFKADNDDKILPLLKPKTNGASRSPFSSKNLPKAQYDIPEEDLKMYNELTAGFRIENGDWLKVTRLTNDFIKSLVNRKNTMDDIKLDMAKKCLKGKEYIHSIEKWNDYIKYLKNNL